MHLPCPPLFVKVSNLSYISACYNCRKDWPNLLLQSVTIYSSEMSPPKYRGALNLLFQWCVTIGIIIAQLINYGTETNYKVGWRISLALAAVPAVMILLGGLFLPETPSSLISRDLHDQGRKVSNLSETSSDIAFFPQETPTVDVLTSWHLISCCVLVLILCSSDYSCGELNSCGELEVMICAVSLSHDSPWKSWPCRLYWMAATTVLVCM